MSNNNLNSNFMVSPFLPLGSNVALTNKQFIYTSDVINPPTPGGIINLNGNVRISPGFSLSQGSLFNFPYQIYSGGLITGAFVIASGDAEIAKVTIRANSEDIAIASPGSFNVLVEMVIKKLTVTTDATIGGNLTVDGVATYSGGIIVTGNVSVTGNIFTKSGGDIYTEDGDILVGTLGGVGDLKVMGTGSITTTSGNITAQGGGNVTTTSGNIIANGNGDIYTTGATGNIYTSAGGNIYTSAGGNIYALGSGTISTVNGDISSNTGNIFTGGTIYTTGTNGGIYTTGSNGDIYTTGGGDIYALGSGTISTVNGDISSNTGDIFTNSGNISTSSGNISTAAFGTISTVNGNIQTTGIGNIVATGTGGIQTVSGDISSNSGDIFTASGTIASGGGNIYTIGSGTISTVDGNIQTTGTGNIVATGTGGIQTVSGDISSNSGDIFTASGTISTGTGNISTTSGSLITTTGDVQTPEVIYTSEAKQTVDGYFENGTLKQQWGYETIAGTGVTKNYPVAFTSGRPVLQVTVEPTAGAGANDIVTCWVTANNTTGFTVVCKQHDTTGTAAPSNVTGRVYWTAIGV